MSTDVWAELAASAAWVPAILLGLALGVGLAWWWWKGGSNHD